MTPCEHLVHAREALAGRSWASTWRVRCALLEHEEPDAASIKSLLRELRRLKEPDLGRLAAERHLSEAVRLLTAEGAAS